MMHPDRWSTIAELARLARDTDDAPTRARLLDAIERQTEAGALDGPRPATWGERLAASAPDSLAVAGCFALGALGVLEGSTAAALALAVLTGRMVPASPKGRTPSGGGPPSTGGGGLSALPVSFLTGTVPALVSAVVSSRSAAAEPESPAPPERPALPELRPAAPDGERPSLHA